MKEKFKNAMAKVNNLMGDVMSHHVGAYAGQSTLFFLICIIPVLMLLMTMVRYTSVTKADVLTAVLQIFPTSVASWINDIVTEVYNLAMGAVLPLTILTTLWAAGKGVMAITSGLNEICQCPETRSYVFIRIRAAFYTVLFLVMIVLLLLLSFGNEFANFVADFNIPVVVVDIVNLIVSLSNYIAPVFIVAIMLLVYRFLPNRKDSFFHQLPGAVFTAVGWYIISWIFSIYLDLFPNFSTMYGSLTTLVLVMLWLYFTMYIILLGGELNRIIFPETVVRKKDKNKEKTEEEISEQLPEQQGEG